MDQSDSREQAIRVLEAYRAELRTKLEQAKRDLEAVEHSIHLLGGTGPKPDAEDVPGSGAYASLPPQQAVEKFLREHPERPFKPSVLARKLRSLGYEPTTTDPNVFVTQVRSACLRLAQKGMVERTEVNGKVAFQRSSANPPLSEGGQSR